MQINKQSTQLPGFGKDTSPGGDHILGVIVNPRSRRNKEHLDEITEAVSNCSKTRYRVAIERGERSNILAELGADTDNVLTISGGYATV